MARVGEIRMWMLRGQGGQVELCPKATDYYTILYRHIPAVFQYLLKVYLVVFTFQLLAF